MLTFAGTQYLGVSVPSHFWEQNSINTFIIKKSGRKTFVTVLTFWKVCVIFICTFTYPMCDLSNSVSIPRRCVYLQRGHFNLWLLVKRQPRNLSGFLST